MKPRRVAPHLRGHVVRLVRAGAVLERRAGGKWYGHAVQPLGLVVIEARDPTWAAGPVDPAGRCPTFKEDGWAAFLAMGPDGRRYMLTTPRPGRAGNHTRRGLVRQACRFLRHLHGEEGPGAKGAAEDPDQLPLPWGEPGRALVVRLEERLVAGDALELEGGASSG